LQIEDPWGRRLDFKSLSLENVSGFLNDPRPAVRDNAMEEIIDRREASIDLLHRILTSSKDEPIRIATVFALYRINLPAAIHAVRDGLNDSSVLVRTATARVLGMAKDPQAVGKLMVRVLMDSASVRRQAATALGQIGDDRAISALLEASANPNDRVVEHAIIYSLITLNKPEGMVLALKHPSENVRRSALIALDQMDSSPLRKNDVLPFLENKNEALQSTGMWVVSHHPEWSDIVVDFLRSKFTTEQLTENERVSISNLMITFSGERQLQDFVATTMRNPATPEAEKMFLLDVIGSSPLEKLPGQWIQMLEIAWTISLSRTWKNFLKRTRLPCKPPELP
jgi:hypothetical protein